MLRKLSLAVTAALLATGAAAAQPGSAFPWSVNEAGVYQPAVYLAPVSQPLPIGPAAAQSATFPMSLSESGPNDHVLYAMPSAAAVQPSRAELRASSRLGNPSEPAASQQTVRVEPSVRYINVNHFDRVRLIDAKGQSFAWTFDTLDEGSFPLQAIAPSGFDAGRVVVYVRHPQAHIATD